MSALARTPSGDVAIPLVVNHDLATLTQWKLTDEFNLGQGEWQFNQVEGFPWIQQILGLKGITQTQIRALLHQAILQTPAVVSVDDLQLVVDPVSRSLDYTFSATLDTGAVLTGGSGQPFVVTGGTGS